jgi:hypothetical protein
MLVDQTILYAHQYLTNHPDLPPDSRASEWRETDIDEMKQFIALTLLMGVIKKPRNE